MAWSAPRVWTTGEIVTAAMLNTDIYGNMLETAVSKVTTAGDMVYASAANALARLPVGANGQFLTVTAGLPAWGAVPGTTNANVASAIGATTAGDVFYYDGANIVRLGIGTARQVLQTNAGATAPAWAASPQSVLTATGDLLYASAANTLARLGIGTSLHMLTVSAGVPSWVASPQSVLSSTGDLLYASAANTLARLGLGTARQVLQTNAGVTAPQWVASPQSVMTATGDILYASAANTITRLPIGTNTQVLSVNAGVPVWASSAAPGAHASSHLPGGADALTTGAPSSVGTANATGTAAAFARQDHVHDIANGAIDAAALIANAIITDVQIAAANKDGAAGTASMRTLGTGAAQAAAGNHTHAHSALTGIDTDGSSSAIHHTLGTGSTQASAGNHNHSGVYSDAGHTHGFAAITGTVSSGQIADSAITSAKIADGTIATGDIADGQITSAKIADGTIANVDISSGAAIDQTKMRGLRYVKLVKSSAQSVPNVSSTQMTWDDYDDPESWHGGTGTGPVTPTVAGKFLVLVSVMFGVGVIGTRCTIAIRVNGSVATHGDTYASKSADFNVTASALVHLNGSTDYVDVLLFHDNGSAINVGNSSTRNVFEVIHLSAL